jgi:hypothetical protein
VRPELLRRRWPAALALLLEACRHLRVKSVELYYLFGEKRITTSVDGVKTHRIRLAKSANERPHFVRIFYVKRCVF